jgi:hypothetical protein
MVDEERFVGFALCDFCHAIRSKSSKDKTLKPRVTSAEV